MNLEKEWKAIARTISDSLTRQVESLLSDFSQTLKVWLEDILNKPIHPNWRDQLMRFRQDCFFQGIILTTDTLFRLDQLIESRIAGTGRFIHHGPAQRVDQMWQPDGRFIQTSFPNTGDIFENDLAPDYSRPPTIPRFQITARGSRPLHEQAVDPDWQSALLPPDVAQAYANSQRMQLEKMKADQAAKTQEEKKTATSNPAATKPSKDPTEVAFHKHVAAYADFAAKVYQFTIPERDKYEKYVIECFRAQHAGKPLPPQPEFLARKVNEYVERMIWQEAQPRLENISADEAQASAERWRKAELVRKVHQGEVMTPQERADYKVLVNAAAMELRDRISKEHGFLVAFLAPGLPGNVDEFLLAINGFAPVGAVSSRIDPTAVQPFRVGQPPPTSTHLKVGNTYPLVSGRLVLRFTRGARNSTIMLSQELTVELGKLSDEARAIVIDDALATAGTAEQVSDIIRRGISTHTVGQQDLEFTGQVHHAISKKVHAALKIHPSLAGKYSIRDPRFATRAKICNTSKK